MKKRATKPRPRKAGKLDRKEVKTDNKLLPCPFCSGEAEAYVYPWGVGVSCKKCGADGPTPAQENITSTNAAIRLWNKRAK